MNAILETIGRLERRLNVTVPLDQIEAEIESRLKRLARTVKAPGFRTGKVPLKIVAQQYGSQVRQEVVGDAMKRRFADAIREQNLKVAGYPRIEAKPAGEGTQQLEFSATFEIYPEVVVGDVSAVTIERPAVEVAESDIDRTIEILRKQRASFEPVERPAAAGDQVDIDYSGTLGGVEFKGGKASGYRVVLGEGRLLQEFENQISGMRPGESKTFELTFPEDYHGKEMAGKTAVFAVTLNRVLEPRLPELDANFAKSLGVEGGDLEAMRSEIKANLEREVKKRIQLEVKEKVMQALLDVTSLELPNSLIEMEIVRLMGQARRDLKARGMNFKDLPLSPDMFKEQAGRRVGLGLILAELVRAHDLQAGQEQVRAVVEEYAQSYEQPQEVISWYYADETRLAEAESLALEDNVVAWVLRHVRVADRPAGFDELMGDA